MTRHSLFLKTKPTSASDPREGGGVKLGLSLDLTLNLFLKRCAVVNGAAFFVIEQRSK